MNAQYFLLAVPSSVAAAPMVRMVIIGAHQVLSIIHMAYDTRKVAMHTI